MYSTSPDSLDSASIERSRHCSRTEGLLYTQMTDIDAWDLLIPQAPFQSVRDSGVPAHVCTRLGGCSRILAITTRHQPWCALSVPCFASGVDPKGSPDQRRCRSSPSDVIYKGRIYVK